MLPIERALQWYCSLWPYELWNHLLLVGGWCFNPSEKYEFVSWDDEIPNIYGKIIKFMFQTTNQTSISCSPTPKRDVGHLAQPCPKRRPSGSPAIPTWALCNPPKIARRRCRTSSIDPLGIPRIPSFDAATKKRSRSKLTAADPHGFWKYVTYVFFNPVTRCQNQAWLSREAKALLIGVVHVLPGFLSSHAIVKTWSSLYDVRACICACVCPCECVACVGVCVYVHVLYIICFYNCFHMHICTNTVRKREKERERDSAVWILCSMCKISSICRICRNVDVYMHVQLCKYT